MYTMAEAMALDEEVGPDSDDWETIHSSGKLLMECRPRDLCKGRFISMVWSKLLPLAGNVASFLGVTNSFVHNLRRCYNLEGVFFGG